MAYFTPQDRAHSPALQPVPSPSVRPSQRDAEPRTLVVGRGISLQGCVSEAERLVVEGTIEATVIHATHLSISHGGVLKGTVHVEDAQIDGTVDGTLTASNGLSVGALGRVLGSASCKRLRVDDGGQIIGKIEMVEGSAA